MLADSELEEAPEAENVSDDSSDDEEDTTVRVDLSLYKDDDNRDEETQLLLDEASGNEIPMSSEDDEEVEIALTLQGKHNCICVIYSSCMFTYQMFFSNL
jgi:hypothetical protein